MYKDAIINYLGRLKDTIDKISVDNLDEIMCVLEKARMNGRMIFIMGNGGSAATASHFVCDFNKGISYSQETKYKFICLNDNIPSLMAYANDLSYDDVFVNPLKTYFSPGDVVIGISGSGNSKNVVKAIEYAKSNGGITIAFTGFSGGKLYELADYNLHLPIDDMQITEDLHMVLDHCMMKILSKDGCQK
jgi:D-sedoheptulose 7-phosphate isomerase